MIHPLFVQTWETTPVITKWISVTVILLSTLVHLNVISEFTLSFSPFLIKRMQIWRILTPFCYFGRFNMDILLHMVFFLRYSKMLEEGFLHTSDYLFLLIYNITVILLIATFFEFSVLSNILSAAITYIWTRKNRTTQVQLMGCIIFPAFYLPFVVPCFSIFAEQKLPFDEVIGLLVGQSYYYFKYVVRRYNIEILRTPIFLKRLCNEEIEKKIEKKKEPLEENSYLDANHPEQEQKTDIIPEIITEEDKESSEQVQKTEKIPEIITEEDKESSEQQKESFSSYDNEIKEEIRGRSIKEALAELEDSDNEHFLERTSNESEKQDESAKKEILHDNDWHDWSDEKSDDRNDEIE
ncbi:endoplasmic reticulum membrane protein [Pseudoloma neurophilia]|uniref:Derlin n=1 Tax=Pseudoloma neurophilia TaxID=146866 RepID=A0A0R0M351_9MICR|nr:endoplasmic reticulum membrane protein [Pseudoloma neurophilia]